MPQGPQGTPASFWRGFSVGFLVLEGIFIGFHDVAEDFQSLSMIVWRISFGFHDFGEDWRGLERISDGFSWFGETSNAFS